MTLKPLGLPPSYVLRPPGCPLLQQLSPPPPLSPAGLPWNLTGSHANALLGTCEELASLSLSIHPSTFIESPPFPCQPGTGPFCPWRHRPAISMWGWFPHYPCFLDILSFPQILSSQAPLVLLQPHFLAAGSGHSLSQQTARPEGLWTFSTGSNHPDQDTPSNPVTTCSVGKPSLPGFQDSTYLLGLLLLLSFRFPLLNLSFRHQHPNDKRW